MRKTVVLLKSNGVIEGTQEMRCWIVFAVSH